MLGAFQNSFSLVLRFKRDRNPQLKLFQTGNTRVTPWVTVPIHWFPCITEPNITGNTGNR